jgi:hypothetical protein
MGNLSDKDISEQGLELREGTDRKLLLVFAQKPQLITSLAFFKTARCSKEMGLNEGRGES